MDAIRSFVAVEASPATRGRAERLIRKLSEAGAKVRWVAPENMHITLNFLGDVPSVNTPKVCKAVAEVAARFAPFEFSCLGAGAFPSADRPRTVWIGIDEGVGELIALQSELEKAMLDLGFPAEGRRFHPHLTIGRVRGGGPATEELSRLIKKHTEFKAGSTVVDEAVVFASFLDRSGPTYRPMGHGELTGSS